MTFKKKLKTSWLVSFCDNSINPLKIAFISIFFWSTQALFMSKGIEKTDFSAILFSAFVISSLFFLFIKTIYNEINLKSSIFNYLASNRRPILLGSSFIFGSHFFFYLGLQFGPKVATNLTNYLWPLLFIVISHFIFHENLFKKRIIKSILKFLEVSFSENGSEKFYCDRLCLIKLILGFAGVWFLLSNGKVAISTLTNWHGPLLGLIAGFLWAIFSIYLKLLSKSSLISLFIGGTSIFSGILWAVRGFPNILPALHISFYLGIFPLGIAMFAWEKAMKNKHTQEIGMLAFLAPLLSTLWLYIFKIDYINRYSLIGGGLIVIANINLHDIAEKLNNYLEEKDKFKITKATEFKSIWARIAYNKNSNTIADFQTRLKIILSYLAFIFLLFLQKCHLPILK